MAFTLPTTINALTPRTLQARLAPDVRLLRAADMHALANSEALVAAATAQAQAIEAGAAQAYEAERQRGYQDGLMEAKMEQAEQMIENVGRTVDYFARVEGEVVDLVMSSVRKIMADFDDEARVLIVVRNALAVVRNQKKMTLRLQPNMVEKVRAHANELLADYPGVGYLDIVADARLQDQACILESEIGMVEASIEGQLAALEQAFRKVLGARV
ncbi:HrpE/YscL family type III secretion apparatus protein [Lampropedia aestuarii]|uniref:Type 3 secretion system stator protein n=1 Tax=Lampropedia aestuarii TaxID=2562762 RepID=A0A4S5BPL4_9BURK|nr:HrpE/YscL family type III secretion apparatus protein [Lampropedia aestuarii]MDH5857336.1 HrpE/YscL family type III secretion apparatus protein [Lampropedia aestuarii]THJ31546.1 HrpE/YscL family type III secretion apparatus protein [Lampropedia aestuarii]